MYLPSFPFLICRPFRYYNSSAKGYVLRGQGHIFTPKVPEITHLIVILKVRKYKNGHNRPFFMPSPKRRRQLTIEKYTIPIAYTV